ncbi:hypothetical protein OF001_U200027 [Pseudomonas sp. OF001]|nr:hypothetical protein OF001_U200027 [Pseudomonas sp. OF001]
MGAEEAVPQRRLLPCVCLQLHGHPDQAVHPDLRLLAGHRLGVPRVRAAFQQPHHPSERRVHRRRAARRAAAGAALIWNGGVPTRGSPAGSTNDR